MKHHVGEWKSNHFLQILVVQWTDTKEKLETKHKYFGGITGPLSEDSYYFALEEIKQAGEIHKISNSFGCCLGQRGRFQI